MTMGCNIMKISGSEIFVRCLLEQGVDTIFGYPGGAVLNLYDALFNYKDKIKHILTSHEQGASHAADGYARASGKVGVCLATSGPGATNLVTGIATAYMDSVPMVAFTGQVAKSLLGKDSFQEVDITGITMPITKHNYIVKDIKDLANVIRNAFRIAQEGRPGPVLVDICKDVTADFIEFKPKEIQAIPETSVKPKQEELIAAVDLINSSKKPFILAGGGVGISNASLELLDLVNKINSPIATSLMGLGTFPGTHPLYTGLIGMHGTRASNLASKECDLFIAIGARFSDRVISNVKKFVPNAKVIHIDIDPAEIGKNVIAHCPLIGNIRLILKEIIQKVENKKNVDWLDKIEKWGNVSLPSNPNKKDTLKPKYIMNKIYDLTKGKAVITTEVGQNQLWAAQYYKYTKPRTYLSSGGLGTMGYGLGASIGAQVALPDKKIFNIAGDGCFRMNNIELATAVEYKLPIIIVIMNNSVLGMVRQWQDLFYDSRFSSTNIDRATSFTRLAEAYGALAFNVTTEAEADHALKEALKSTDRPVLLNCIIDKDEKVFPIVPPGASIDEIIEE